MDVMLGLVGNLGAVGAVIFIVLYLVKTTLPDLMKAQREDLKEARNEFKAIVSEMQSAHRDAQREMQAAHREAQKEIQSSFKGVTDAIVDKLETVDRHTKANTDQIIHMQKTVIDKLVPFHPGFRLGSDDPSTEEHP